MSRTQLSNSGARMTILACLALAPLFAWGAKTIVVIDDDSAITACVDWLYQSPQVTSRVDALKICRKGVTVECMKSVYQEPKVYSRLKAAEICSDN